METIMLASVQARMIAPWKMMKDSFLHEADAGSYIRICLHILSYKLLSEPWNDLLEGILPGVHLNDPDSRDDFVHDTNPFVGEPGRLKSNVSWITHVV